MGLYATPSIRRCWRWADSMERLPRCQTSTFQSVGRSLAIVVAGYLAGSEAFGVRGTARFHTCVSRPNVTFCDRHLLECLPRLAKTSEQRRPL